MAANWIIIKDNEDWFVEYDTVGHKYRVSYFEHGHFKDEVIFHEQNSNEKIITCPHCKVCSTKVDINNKPAVVVCPVCNNEIKFKDI